jgi:hypothetical protein
MRISDMFKSLQSCAVQYNCDLYVELSSVNKVGSCFIGAQSDSVKISLFQPSPQ